MDIFFNLLLDLIIYPFLPNIGRLFAKFCTPPYREPLVPGDGLPVRDVPEVVYLPGLVPQVPHSPGLLTTEDAQLW